MPIESPFKSARRRRGRISHGFKPVYFCQLQLGSEKVPAVQAAAALMVVALIALSALRVYAQQHVDRVTLSGPRTQSAADEMPRPITPIDLVELRDIGGLRGAISVSPNGEYVAFQIQHGNVARNEYMVGWFVAQIGVNSGLVKPLGNGGDVILVGEETGFVSGARLDMQARWSPDARWIAYRRKHNGEVQLWRSRWDGGVQERLTYNAADVSDFVWSAQGDKIFFEVEGQSREEKRMAMQSEAERGFLYDERFFPGYSTSPVLPGSTDAHASNNVRSNHLWVYDTKWMKERYATNEEMVEYSATTRDVTLDHLEEGRTIRQVVISEESGAAAWLEKETPLSHSRPVWILRALTADGLEYRCDASECTGWGRIIWSARGEEIYFIRSEGANGLTRAIYSWSPSEKTVRTILKTDDWLTACDVANASGLLVCIHEGATTPRKIVTIDPLDGSMCIVVEPNPEFQVFQLTPVEKLEWKEASGEDAAAHLVYPVGYEAGRRYPLVIVQYRSYGFLRGGVGDEYPIHPLAANGFFVLSFDRPERPRPMHGDRYDWERAEWGADLWERSATLSALEIIVDKLDERALIDPRKVGITGLSDGAETVWYAMIHSSRFTVAAASSGGWSPSMYYLVNQATRENYFKRAAELLPYGMGTDHRWKRIAPEFHAATINVPILVQVADRELTASAATVGALMDAEKPIETYVYPNEFHVKWQPKHKLAVYERGIDWFNFWLRGVEDSEHEKADQYKRWKKLQNKHISHLRAAGRGYTLPISRNQ